MKSNFLSKENILIGFYIIYIFIAGLAFEFFPGDEKTPNMGVLMLYLFIPISLVYFMVHLVQQLYGNKKNTKCLIIHAVVWGSILVVLTLFGKNKI